MKLMSFLNDLLITRKIISAPMTSKQKSTEDDLKTIVSPAAEVGGFVKRYPPLASFVNAQLTMLPTRLDKTILQRFITYGNLLLDCQNNGSEQDLLTLLQNLSIDVFRNTNVTVTTAADVYALISTQAVTYSDYLAYQQHLFEREYHGCSHQPSYKYRLFSTLCPEYSKAYTRLLAAKSSSVFARTLRSQDITCLNIDMSWICIVWAIVNAAHHENQGFIRGAFTIARPNQKLLDLLLATNCYTRDPVYLSSHLRYKPERPLMMGFEPFSLGGWGQPWLPFGYRHIHAGLAADTQADTEYADYAFLKLEYHPALDPRKLLRPCRATWHNLRGVFAHGIDYLLSGPVEFHARREKDIPANIKHGIHLLKTELAELHRILQERSDLNVGLLRNIICIHQSLRIHAKRLGNEVVFDLQGMDDSFIKYSKKLVQLGTDLSFNINERLQELSAIVHHIQNHLQEGTMKNNLGVFLGPQGIVMKHIERLCTILNDSICKS